MSYLFLYKDYSDEDRDCCGYVEDKKCRFECGHYFSGVGIHGACYCGREFPDYDGIETVLNEKEWNNLIELSKELNDLGYGIKKDSQRYKKGIEISSKIDNILDKLRSDKNKKLFEKIQEEEIDYLMDEYNFSRNEVEEIFNNYGLDYRDRSIVGCIFNDAYELGYEEMFSCGYADK